MKKKTIVFIIFLCIILDQISKFIVNLKFDVEDSYELIENFYYITYYKNTGIAFGMFPGAKIVIISVSILLLLVLLYELKKFYKEKITALSFCFLIGGLIGNLIDRIYLGYVRDFLDFNPFNLNFPIFNISDACIVIGAILLILSSFNIGGKNEQNNSY